MLARRRMVHREPHRARNHESGARLGEVDRRPDPKGISATIMRRRGRPSEDRGEDAAGRHALLGDGGEELPGHRAPSEEHDVPDDDGHHEHDEPRRDTRQCREAHASPIEAARLFERAEGRVPRAARHAPASFLRSRSTARPATTLIAK